MFKYTTEHIDDYNILVKVYRQDLSDPIHKFILPDYGDWNAIEFAIEENINRLKK